LQFLFLGEDNQSVVDIGPQEANNTVWERHATVRFENGIVLNTIKGFGQIKGCKPQWRTPV
jgi:hypothetical protein